MTSREYGNGKAQQGAQRHATGSRRPLRRWRVRAAGQGGAEIDWLYIRHGKRPIEHGSEILSPKSHHDFSGSGHLLPLWRLSFPIHENSHTMWRGRLSPCRHTGYRVE